MTRKAYNIWPFAEKDCWPGLEEENLQSRASVEGSEVRCPKSNTEMLEPERRGVQKVWKSRA